MIFSFKAGDERVEFGVRSPQPLNDDKWHRVEVEKNIQEAALQLDGQYRKVRPLSPQGRTKLEFYSDLYIGEDTLLQVHTFGDVSVFSSY